MLHKITLVHTQIITKLLHTHTQTQNRVVCINKQVFAQELSPWPDLLYQWPLFS